MDGIRIQAFHDQRYFFFFSQFSSQFCYLDLPLRTLKLIAKHEAHHTRSKVKYLSIQTFSIFISFWAPILALLDPNPYFPYPDLGCQNNTDRHRSGFESQTLIFISLLLFFVVKNHAPGGFKELASCLKEIITHLLEY